MSITALSRPMQPIPTHLIACDDEYGSELGFALGDTKPGYDGFSAARSGTLLAHDLLEHLNGPEAIGPVLDEFQALGALWYVRGWDPDLLNNTRRGRSYQNPIRSVGSDVASMAMSWEGEFYNALGLPVPAVDDENELDFELIIESARDQMIGDVNDDFDFDGYLSTAILCMRLGWNNAKLRYGTRDRAGEFFIMVRDEVDRALKGIEWEGQAFVLTLTENDCTIEPEPDIEDEEIEEMDKNNE